ncbi:MAG: glycosyltransferase family 4 protein [Patescibacteria group bacterium]|jgi:glycosyltransferase involved in cell wall biosynthesis
MHDLTSHEKIFLNDLYISKIIFFMSSAQILNSDATLERIKKLHFITKNSYIVPHGNYVNFYTNTVSQIVSRRLLHIPKDEFVYLFFGRIEKYKGVDLLINLFNKANIKGTRLLIAGNASDPSIKKSLQSINEKSIDIHIGFVPDDKVQVYMNAANVVVLPFRKITTSGSALLALSFGKPIICPQLGDLVEFPDDFTFFYNPQNSKNLLNTLVSVYKDRKNLGSKGRQALKYAQSISWQEAATKTQLVYNSLD